MITSEDEQLGHFFRLIFRPSWLRWYALIPPHVPNSMSLSIAYRRHSGRNGHCPQSSFARGDGYGASSPSASSQKNVDAGSRTHFFSELAIQLVSAHAVVIITLPYHNARETFGR